MTSPAPSTLPVETLAEKLEGYCIDWNGEPIVDASTPRVELECRELREAIAALRSQSSRIAELEADLAEALEGKKGFAESYVAARTYGLKAVHEATELRNKLSQLQADMGRMREALEGMNAVSAHQTNRVFPPMDIGGFTIPQMVHPLTCGNDSRHGNLYPYWNGDIVTLVCPDCDYVQANTGPIARVRNGEGR